MASYTDIRNLVETNLPTNGVNQIMAKEHREVENAIIDKVEEVDNAKIDKFPMSSGGNITTREAGGGISDSGKSIETGLFYPSGNTNKVPTSDIVKTAIDGVASTVNNKADKIGYTGTPYLTQVAIDGNYESSNVFIQNGGSLNSATDQIATNNITNAAITQAKNDAKAYADGLVVGLLDDRGNYDASTNLFPSSGGSGTSGAILKGDVWRISVGGTIGGEVYSIGEWVRALADDPGQTSSNWAKTYRASQATETSMGIGKVVTQAVIQDNTTTNDIDFVTAKKFWQGIAKMVTLGWTWTVNQVFQAGANFGSAAQMIVNSSGNITKINNVATSFPSSQGAANTSLINDGSGNLSWKTSAFNQSLFTAPTTTTSTTPVMLGIGGTAVLTPTKSGKVLITVSSDTDNTVAGNGIQIQIAYGIGTAPTNGSAATGTTLGNAPIVTSQAGLLGLTPGRSGISANGAVQLTVGTAYWFDLQYNAIGGGTARLRNLSVSIVEL